MPTYKYKCSNCGEDFSVVQKMADDKLITCPECKHETLVRQITTVPTIFKGEGWVDKK